MMSYRAKGFSKYYGNQQFNLKFKVKEKTPEKRKIIFSRGKD